jgi:hypothetical protein
MGLDDERLAGLDNDRIRYNQLSPTALHFKSRLNLI